MRWLLLFSAVPLLAWGGPALAATQTDFADCQQMQDLNLGIAGCTKIAEDPNGIVSDRATAYFDRGIDHFVRGELDAAIADWSASVKLVPTYAHAYNNLAKAYRAKGDYQHALDGYSQAIKLDPQLVSAFKGRGITYFANGDAAKAEADFRRAESMDSSDPYTALWLNIAVRRQNQPYDITKSAIHLNMGAWPAPLLLLYAGQVNPHEVAVSAQNIDPVITQARLCDAYFFIGESMLLSSDKGDKDEATDLFQRTLKVCPATADQYSVAAAELKAMGKPLEAPGESAEQGAPAKSVQ